MNKVLKIILLSLGLVTVSYAFISFKHFEYVSDFQSNEKGRPVFRAHAIYPFEINGMYEVITRYDQYKRYFPKFKESMVLEQNQDEALILLKAKLPWPLNDLWVKAKVVKDQKNHRINWSKVDGNFKSFEGFAKLDPQGDKVKLTMNATLELKFYVPKFAFRWVARNFVPKSLFHLNTHFMIHDRRTIKTKDQMKLLPKGS